MLFSASATQDEVVERIYRVEGDGFGDGESVDAETFVRRCPVPRHILEAREPFFWTKTIATEGELTKSFASPADWASMAFKSRYSARRGWKAR